MLLKIGADIIVLIHFFWILFLFFGAIWGVRSSRVKVFHLFGLFFAVLIQVLGWYCPLTHLEFWLRSKHNPGLVYIGSFIVHYVEKVVYLELSQTTIFIFTIFLCLFNTSIYLWKGKIPIAGYREK